MIEDQMISIQLSLNECAMWIGYAFVAYQMALALAAIPVGSYLLWRYRRRQASQTV